MTNNTIFSETFTIDITEEREDTLRDMIEEQLNDNERKTTDREKLLRLLDDRIVIDRIKHKLLQQGFVLQKKNIFGIDVSHEYMKRK